MLTPILLDVEEYLKVLLKSIIESPKKLAQLADNKTVLVDATERTHYCHKDNELPKKFSGKQCVHTLKNTIISLEILKIFYVGKTVSGSVHDYKLFKSEFDLKIAWFEAIKIVVN